jgi:single-stranded DNA-specific DHH superfamily exonuclease
MFDQLKGKGILIHHWDTDGICSASLMLRHLKDKNIVNKTPQLGNYYLTEQELDEYSKFDFVIVVDMNLPEDNILLLSKKAKVMIFDHHLGREIKQVFHHNPVIKGQNPDEYPSASWIINDFLGNDVNLFSILGIVGDHEQKIIKNKKFIEIINEFCKKNNLTLDEMLKMVYLIDSNYKLGDKKTVEEAPHFLLKMNSNDDLLNNKKWNKNFKKLNDELTKQLKIPSDEINGIILKKINTPYNIISTITRRVAWDSGKDAIVINTGFFGDRDQIYVRCKKSAEPMITRGKSLGYKCGGKKEVLGAIVPKEKTDSFVKEIIDFLS